MSEQSQKTVEYNFADDKIEALRPLDYICVEFNPQVSGITQFRVRYPDDYEASYMADIFDDQVLIYSTENDTEAYLSWPKTQRSWVHIDQHLTASWTIDSANRHTLLIEPRDDETTVVAETEPVVTEDTIEKMSVPQLPETRQPLSTPVGCNVLSKYPNRASQDDAYADEVAGVYVVADGVSASKYAREAAMIVSETTEHYAKLLTAEQRHQKDPAASLCKVLRRANDTMYERHGEDAKTTATIAQIEHDINGDPFCAWASVGDSSLHLYSPGQELQQVSSNENNEQQHVITNWLGKTELAVDPENSGYFQCQPGEVVIIMSDGIGDQLEWDTAAKVRLQGLLSSLPPNPTSEQLDDMARYITENFTDKKDDRSIILVPIPQCI